jgi:mannose-6-phosphate isomerase-like protein (cupin superfamily)
MPSILAKIKAIFSRSRSRPTAQPQILSTDTIKSLPTTSFSDPSHGTCTWKTLISSPVTQTDTFTVGIATCAPRTGILCPHRHKQAEVYHIIAGTGVMSIDGKETKVSQGDVVYVPGMVRHGIRNEDGEMELRWFYVFAVNSFEEVRYVW